MEIARFDVTKWITNELVSMKFVYKICKIIKRKFKWTLSNCILLYCIILNMVYIKKLYNFNEKSECEQSIKR